MKKFFKFGSSKKSSTKGWSSPHRRSLASIDSSVSGLSISDSVELGSFSTYKDGIKGYKIDPSRDKSLTKLHIACWTGDLDKVKKHIKKIDVNLVDSESRTPLHLAAARAHKDVIWFLLGSKAKPNLPDIDGNTPLLKAVQCGHADIVQFLLERGADPKALDDNGNTGLHHVAADGQQDIAFALIQKGADINAKNEDGITPLMFSTINGQMDMAELLLRHGASLSISDKERKTCLMLACEKGYNDLVAIFMQHGDDESAVNNAGHTAEDIAKMAGHDACVSTLKDFRLRRNSSHQTQYAEKEFDSLELSGPQMNEAILPNKRTNDLNSESDDHSRASQVDLHADFNDSDLGSWNDDDDDASEASIQKDPGTSINLSKFLACTAVSSRSEAWDEDLEDNHPESQKILQDKDVFEKGKDELAINKSEELQKSKADDFAVLSVPLVSIKESGVVLQNSMAAPENPGVPHNALRKDRNFLAEFGLSDLSEVSTPTFSGFSMKDEAHKDADTDLEDDEITHDDADKLAFATGKQEIQVEASLERVGENAGKKSVDFSSTEHADLPNKETNGNLTRAHQNMGSLQTVYMSVTKDGSFNDGSGTDWDDESEDDSNDGPIHIHPIILQKMPKEDPHSGEMQQWDSQTTQTRKEWGGDPSDGQSLPVAPVTVPSKGISETGQKLEELNCDPYKVSTDSRKALPSNVLSSEGTLGRQGTMHEVEEMWVKNPSVEIGKEGVQTHAKHEFLASGNEEAQISVKEKAKLFMKIEAKPIAVEMAETIVRKDLNEDADDIYYAELALVNSCDTTRSNTLDGQKKENDDQNSHPIHAEIENPDMASVEQLWSHIWTQICGKLNKENDTESSDEISSVAITDQVNKDSSFSSADVDNSVSSAHDDILTYQHLASFLKDPNSSMRVIALVQHLRLAWQKEQDKSKIFIQKIKLLKSESQRTTDKIQSLKLSKVDTESAVHQLEAELESAKHSLQSQENLRANVELELDRSKAQLLVMEEKLLQEMAARQQAELLSKANQGKAKLNQDLIFQMSAHIPNKGNSAADFSCQTDGNFSQDTPVYLAELTALAVEKEKLEREILSLKQQVDSLSLSFSQKNNQLSKLEEQLETLQKEFILMEKDLTQANKNLAESKRENSVKEVTEILLNKRLEELQEDYLNATSKVVSSVEKNGQLSKDLEIMSNNLEECRLSKTLLENEIQTVKAKEERLQISLKTQMNESEQHKQELTDLRKRLSHLQSEHSKIKFELDNGNKLQQLVLDQEETQHQVATAKEERFVSMVNENEGLKHQVEELKEQEMLNAQKVNVLTEKLLRANAMKTEVSELHSQLAVSNNKLSLAEVKIEEGKKKLQEEHMKGLQFLTVEKELEETTQKLNLANDTIATIEKLLAMAQENEKNQDTQLHNEFQGVVLQLQEADNQIKELGKQLNKKDELIQDLTLRWEHHAKEVSREKLTSSSLHPAQIKVNLLGKTSSNAENGKDVLNYYLQGAAPSTASNGPDVSAEANQEWPEIHSVMSPLKLSKYDEALERLQNQVDELRKQSKNGKIAKCNDQGVQVNLNSDDQKTVPGLAAESLNHQMDLLGKRLEEERHQKVDYFAQIKDQKQQLEKVNGLLKNALQMQNVQHQFDESAHTLKNTMDDVAVASMKHNWEIGARQELNQQLDKINKFLEERSHVNDHLEQLKKEREVRLHRDYQHAVHDLRLEVQQLHDELRGKECDRKALEEQNEHRQQLKEARKRVASKLRNLDKEKSKLSKQRMGFSSRSKDALFALSMPDYDWASLTKTGGKSPSTPGSPIINNLRTFKHLEGGLSFKLGFDQDPIVAQQISGSAAYDSQYKSNLNLSLDKTTSEYLDQLKRKYQL